MFHMKQPKPNIEHFCSDLRRYNKTHRLIGNVSCETLVHESLRAIANSREEFSDYSLMVDVGAGAGILGYAWMLSGEGRGAIFLEPDKKAVAFLHLHFSTYKGTKVIHKRLEDLKLEDLTALEPNVQKIFLAARAFSSSMPIEECYRKAQLHIPLFNFEKKQEDYFLSPVKI